MEKLKGDYVKSGITYISVDPEEKKQVIAVRQLDRQMKVFEQLEKGEPAGDGGDEDEMNDGEMRLESIKSEILSIPGIIGPASYKVQASGETQDCGCEKEKAVEVVSYRHLLKL